MPHKHRRDKAKSDPSYWDLPPSKTAHALAVTKAPKSASVSRRDDGKGPHKLSRSKDDTPRAFARLLQPYRPPRSGLDDGARPSKKRKMASTNASNPISSTDTTDPVHPSEDLKIQPHEPLSHFAARVNTALPFSTLTKSKGTNDPSPSRIGRARQTKTEKKMQKMQRDWREEDQRIKDSKLIEGEDAEGAVDEEGVEDMGVEEDRAPARRKGKKKRSDDEDEDPWMGVGLKSTRQEDKDWSLGLVGLHDVVQAPPKFVRPSKGRDGRGIKMGEGGLKRQVELGEARRSIVEGYRAMMKQKREAVQ